MKQALKDIFWVALVAFVFMSFLSGCATLGEMLTGQKEIAPPARFIVMERGVAADGTEIANGFLDEERTRAAQHQILPDGTERWIEITDPKAIKLIRTGAGLLGYGGLGDALASILGAAVTVFGARKTKEIVHVVRESKTTV